LDVKINGKILAGAILAIGVLVFLQMQTPARKFEVSYADLQASLDHELSRSSEVGFLPRVEFRTSKVKVDNGVVIEGSGRWFSLGAGGFTLPDITISARLPTEPATWSVSNGTLNINQVQLTRAFQEPYGLTNGMDEREANSRGWQDRLSIFVRRLDVFEDEALIAGDWRVIAVQSRPDRLIFSLEK
jgi:hypothetical protein